MSAEIDQILQPFILQYQVAVAVAVVAFIALVGVVICWWAYEKFFTPDESKEIRRAFRRKTALMGIGGDDGYLDILHAATSGPEGFLESKPKGATQEHYSGALPRPKIFDEDDLEYSDVNSENPQTKFDAKKTVAVANYISMLASRRLLLRGARVPIWLAYRGKAVLTSLYGLAALQLVEALCKLNDDANKFGLTDIANAFAVVDILAIKALFSQQWNESQINAQEADKERKGELKAKKFAGKDSLIMMFAVMIVLVVVVIILVGLLYFFGGGGSAPTQ